MSKYALVEGEYIKDIINSIPQDIHPDLKSLYKQVPEELERKISHAYTYVDGEFVEPVVGDSFEIIIKTVRNWRDNYLSDTDKYLIPDFPISAEKLEKIKAYRQTLRDFPSTVKKTVTRIQDVVWPKNPLS